MAHALTALRLLLVAPVAVGLARPTLFAPWLLLALVVIAIVTDYADGKVARAQGTASPAGQLFDHATDFLFVTSGLAGAAAAGRVTPWLPPLIVVAFTQYVLDSYWWYRQKQLRMSTIGRWNGIFYFVPVTAIAAVRMAPLDALAPLVLPTAQLLGYALVVSTLVSIVDRGLAESKARGY